ncbi:MAG: Shedu anti-phage system protein SduA domain-containing protein [Acholeplasmataceae bacterium]
MIYKFKFNLVTNRNLYYRTDDFIEVVHSKGNIFRIFPYFTLDNKFYPSDVKLGFEIQEYYKNSQDKYIQSTHNKGSKKTFRITSIISLTVSNLRACINNYFQDNPTYDGQYIIDYDDSIKYFSFKDIKQNHVSLVKEIIDSFQEFEEIEISHTLAISKLLSKFKSDLIIAIEQNEHKIQDVLKLYKDILFLVLIGFDSTLDFEVIVQSDTYSDNRIDIISSKPYNHINLIELKQAKAIFFNKKKKYRGNTYKPTEELSKAIHQTNVQRAHMAISSSESYKIYGSSILLYGNKKNEFSSHPDKEILNENLEIIKYNNKNITIMSYDEVLERIESLLYKQKNSDFTL